MPRELSKISPQWWDYTTLDDELIQDAAKLNENDLLQLSRPGFEVVFYDTLEEFYLAEALEYVSAWKEATPDNPVGICGPIGPTEQLPLVAQLVNELKLDLSAAHFWGMDELSLSVGSFSGKTLHAEGWRRHSHMGFSAKPDFDPLTDALSSFHYSHPQAKE